MVMSPSALAAGLARPPIAEVARVGIGGDLGAGGVDRLEDPPVTPRGRRDGVAVAAEAGRYAGRAGLGAWAPARLGGRAGSFREPVGVVDVDDLEVQGGAAALVGRADHADLGKASKIIGAADQLGWPAGGGSTNGVVSWPEGPVPVEGAAASVTAMYGVRAWVVGGLGGGHGWCPRRSDGGDGVRGSGGSGARAATSRSRRALAKAGSGAMVRSGPGGRRADQPRFVTSPGQDGGGPGVRILVGGAERPPGPYQQRLGPRCRRSRWWAPGTPAVEVAEAQAARWRAPMPARTSRRPVRREVGLLRVVLGRVGLGGQHELGAPPAAEWPVVGPRCGGHADQPGDGQRRHLALLHGVEPEDRLEVTSSATDRPRTGAAGSRDPAGPGRTAPGGRPPGRHPQRRDRWTRPPIRADAPTSDARDRSACTGSRGGTSARRPGPGRTRTGSAGGNVSTENQGVVTWGTRGTVPP